MAQIFRRPPGRSEWVSTSHVALHHAQAACGGLAGTAGTVPGKPEGRWDEDPIGVASCLGGSPAGLLVPVKPAAARPLPSPGRAGAAVCAGAGCGGWPSYSARCWQTKSSCKEWRPRAKPTRQAMAGSVGPQRYTDSAANGAVLACPGNPERRAKPAPAREVTVNSRPALLSAVASAPQSRRAPEALTTLDHLAISSFSTAPNCAGVVA